jgi:hypothetical protein
MSEQGMPQGITSIGSVIGHDPQTAVPQGMTPITTAGRVDYANMPTAELLGAYWAFAGNNLADVATQLVNTMGQGAVQATQGDLQRLVIAGMGLRKAFGRMISRDDAGRDLGVNLPEGLSPSFTLYLQAVRLKPEDDADRKLAGEFKTIVRKRIRTLRKPD